MRVIAGKARGRRLQAVPGDATRPITDRAKEALFSILQPELPGARMLDLFAGTGQVGIEALSRGAASCDFNELATPALKVIHANLQATGLAGPEARVLRRDAFRLLEAPPPVPYDLIFIAPPQYKGLWKRALLAVDAAAEAWLGEAGLVVVQIHPREAEDLDLAALELDDLRNYGSVELRFYRPREDGDTRDSGDPLDTLDTLDPLEPAAADDLSDPDDPSPLDAWEDADDPPETDHAADGA